MLFKCTSQQLFVMYGQKIIHLVKGKDWIISAFLKPPVQSACSYHNGPE